MKGQIINELKNEERALRLEIVIKTLIKEVLRVCMIQKMVKDADHHEKVPISYRLSTIDSC